MALENRTLHGDESEVLNLWVLPGPW